MKERLQKLLSAAGVCSRRAAEGYITAGRVTVNGETALLGQQADPETDDIRVDTCSRLPAVGAVSAGWLPSAGADQCRG